MSEVEYLIASLGDRITRIEKLETELEVERGERDEFVAALRAEGWSLQRIGSAVGRSKQTVSQWMR